MEHHELYFMLTYLSWLQLGLGKMLRMDILLLPKHWDMGGISSVEITLSRDKKDDANVMIDRVANCFMFRL